jgi:hypothetical protein
MKGLMTVLTDGRYEVKSSLRIPNVMQFERGKIAHMTKIWHSGLALKELGWA